MSVHRIYKCDHCGKPSGPVGDYSNPPAGWIAIDLVKCGKPSSDDLHASACSEGCAATLLRDYTATWRPA